MEKVNKAKCYFYGYTLILIVILYLFSCFTNKDYLPKKEYESFNRYKKTLAMIELDVDALFVPIPWPCDWVPHIIPQDEEGKPME